MFYTSIIGDKDEPRTDIKVFTDRHWIGSDRMEAKIYKVVPHKFFDSEFSIWLDGNVFPLKPEEEFIKLLGDKDIAVFKHPERNCLFDEAQFCAKIGKDEPEIIEKHINKYVGFPKNAGLYACGVIVRRHTERMKQLCEKWWEEIRLGSSRDQISFPYVFPKEVISIIPGNLWSNDLVEIKSHKK